jgi:protocatechuate 3,4-dioxygenase alpha subunit
MIVSPFCTIGPYFPFEFVDELADLTNGGLAQGEGIVVRGRVLEQGGAPTRNSIVEIWQPDANGILHHPLDPRYAERDKKFSGFGRGRTLPDGSYSIRTVMPGASADRAPHINVGVLAIGLIRRAVTTVFFTNAPDPVLDCVPAARRSLLIAGKQADGSYLFDIHLRGEAETPFFAD